MKKIPEVIYPNKIVGQMEGTVEIPLERISKFTYQQAISQNGYLVKAHIKKEHRKYYCKPYLVIRIKDMTYFRGQLTRAFRFMPWKTKTVGKENAVWELKIKEIIPDIGRY